MHTTPWPWKVKLLKRDKQFGVDMKRSVKLRYIFRCKWAKWPLELDSNISCPWKVISWKWRRHLVELDSKCLDRERKSVERELNFAPFGFPYYCTENKQNQCLMAVFISDKHTILTKITQNLNIMHQSFDL